MLGIPFRNVKAAQSFLHLLATLLHRRYGAEAPNVGFVDSVKAVNVSVSTADSKHTELGSCHKA